MRSSPPISHCRSADPPIFSFNSQAWERNNISYREAGFLSNPRVPLSVSSAVRVVDLSDPLLRARPAEGRADVDASGAAADVMKALMAMGEARVLKVKGVGQNGSFCGLGRWAFLTKGWGGRSRFFLVTESAGG